MLNVDAGFGHTRIIAGELRMPSSRYDLTRASTFLRTLKAAAESIPARVVAKLRMEKKGRGGKTVTVVDNLPNNAAFLKDLCQDLKRACGTGGTAAEDAIELQGDLRERVRELLLSKGFAVKG